jgi:rsbT co-antagonist protein RsbR
MLMNADPDTTGTEQAWWDKESSYRVLVDTVEDYGILMLDPDGIVRTWNPGAQRIKGYTADEIIGQNFEVFYPKEQRDSGFPARELEEARAKGRFEDEGWRIRKDGTQFWANVVVTALHDENGVLQGFAKVTRDLTEKRLADQRIRQQSQEIMELSTPVIQIWDGIVAVPLIGNLDSQRTQLFMERLLERIVETNSPMALVDIQGVPTIDTQTAQHLIETITAVRLLGAQVILTGVRPVIAQTLVHLGIDLSGITTRASMAAGLKVAMEAMALEIVSSNRVEG